MGKWGEGMQGGAWQPWEEESLEPSDPFPHLALSLSPDQRVSGTQPSSRGRVGFRPHYWAFSVHVGLSCSGYSFSQEVLVFSDQLLSREPLRIPGHPF